MTRGGEVGLGSLLALSLLLLVGVSAPAAAAASYPPPSVTGTMWENGQVLCQFGATMPTVGVSAVAAPDAGVSLSGVSLEERAPNGTTMATAELGGSTWTVANLSDSDGYDLAYTLHAGLEAGLGTGPSIGSADLGVAFVLPAYSGSPDGPTNVVGAIFTVANWSWVSPSDHLVLAFTISSGSPGTEHLATTTAAGWLLVGAANGTGAELDQVGINATANATNATASAVSVPVQGSVVLASSEEATVTVTLGSSAGAFRAVSFAARIGVTIPSTVAGIPIADLAAAGVAGIVASIGIALATRRIRQTPSRLIYAEE